jgi:uncharacterized HhH-GPD family protein
MEQAFWAPYELRRRLGHDLDARELADYDPDAIVELFSRRPALHRFPKANAHRAQELCRVIVDKYDGDAARLWTEAKSGAELVSRLTQLPGFGKQKSQIFAALLGKQFGVRPKGWREATGAYGEDGVFRSVADITDETALAKVREYKKSMKATAKGDA